MHKNKSNVQSSKTSLHQRNIDKQSSLKSQNQPENSQTQKQQGKENLFSTNKIDSKLLMKLMKNLSNTQLDKKDKDIQKEQKIESQNEEKFKEIKNSDKILKGVLKLNLMKNYTVGYNHNALEKCQLILQNYRYRKIRAARIQKSIYKVVLIYYNKFFDLVTQIQIRQNAMINFAEFLHEFVTNKNKQLKHQFFDGYKRLNKAYDIFEFQRNKDINNWQEGCFDILKDYDRQPKSMMSLLNNNSNYFKFLTFFDYFQRLQVKNNKKEYLQDFFNMLKGDHEKIKNKKEAVHKLAQLFKKSDKKNKKESFNIIQNKKSKLQAQFLIQSVYLVKLNKIKQAFDSIKKQPEKIQKKKTTSDLNQSPEFKGTQARHKIKKNTGNMNILNIPKRKKLDLEAFIKYIEYLKFLREKHAFYKILASIKNPKEEKVIHGRISILKRPIEYEQWSDQYKQYVHQGQQDPEISSNWIRQDSINHAISQRNLGFGQLHQSQVNLNSTTQSVQDFRQLKKKFSQADLRQRVKQRGERPPPPDTLGIDNFQRTTSNLNKSGYIVRKKQKWTKKYQPSFIQENEFHNVNDMYGQNIVTQSTANFYPQQQTENQHNRNNQVSKFTKTYKKTKNGQVVKKTTKRTTTKRSYIK